MLVVNSARDPEYLLKFLPDTMRAKLAKFVVVDAVGLAEQRGSSPWMFVRDLSELAFDRMSTEGAVERLAIGLGIAAPLIGALVAATGELPLDGSPRWWPTATPCSAAPSSTGCSSSPSRDAQRDRHPAAAPPRQPRDAAPLTSRPNSQRTREEAPCPYAAPSSRSTCGCRSQA